MTSQKALGHVCMWILSVIMYCVHAVCQVDRWLMIIWYTTNRSYLNSPYAFGRSEELVCDSAYGPAVCSWYTCSPAFRDPISFHCSGHSKLSVGGKTDREEIRASTLYQTGQWHHQLCGTESHIPEPHNIPESHLMGCCTGWSKSFGGFSSSFGTSYSNLVYTVDDTEPSI